MQSKIMNRVLIVLCSLFTSLAMAQKITVAFIPMSYDEERISRNDAKIIQETVLNAFVSSKRFSVVEREKLEEIAKEKSLQRTEAFMDSKETFTEGMNKGASYLIDGNIISVRNSESKHGWECAVNIQLKVLDVSTGEILATENISSEILPVNQAIKEAEKVYLTKDEIAKLALKEKHLREPKANSDDAIMVALQRLSENVQKFTSFNFPMSVSVVEWDVKKKKDFILAAGFNSGIHRGQLLDIVTITEATVGEQTIERKVKIGTAYVYRVDDANFSAATIIDGVKEVLKAKTNNAKLGVITR